MKLRVTVEVSQSQLDMLVNLAIRMGFIRDDPRTHWTSQELKKAARFAIERLAVAKAGR